MTTEDRQRAAQFCENARYFLALGTERALQSALYFFDQALAVDPRHAPAYAGKARCYAEIGDGGYVTPPLPQLRALDFANRALAIAPNADASLVRAKALVELRYAWDDAHTELGRAASLPEADGMRALLFIYSGRFNDAMDATTTPFHRALALLYARRPREAMPLFERITAESTRLWNVPALLGLAFYLDGMPDRAIAIWEDARREHPVAGAYLVHAYGALGRTDEFYALRTELEERVPTAYRSPVWDAIGAIGAGQASDAIAALERGFAVRDPWMPRVLVEPMLAPLRGDAAFERLAAELRDGTELPRRPGT